MAFSLIRCHFFPNVWQLTSTWIRESKLYLERITKQNVLDQMFFFFKCPATYWYMNHGGPQSGSGIPLWEGFLIGCHSHSNAQQLINTWIMDSQSYLERTMKWKKCSLMGWFLIGCSSFPSSCQLISTWIARTVSGEDHNESVRTESGKDHMDHGQCYPKIGVLDKMCFFSKCPSTTVAVHGSQTALSQK